LCYRCNVIMIVNDLFIPDEIILPDSRAWDKQSLGFQPMTRFTSAANQYFKRACDLNEIFKAV
jgi:hypothetical protein